ncbi:hypothetical protein [Salisediminibacterium selenitireducens]|uniref:Uncharacterized protein n=1 Tax=Bacillus selenitireducens (strain ATCC 700615 / DSM 15326 / MLS10) TaxID=439292 RepID=D6XYM5_BACIE|nr:hypothetical protein [Salisediminibacterium selenitireducens]ADH98183.1 hypothetical protein Bsel_0648 [[Bacillus] selenitireducens MLS10]
MNRRETDRLTQTLKPDGKLRKADRERMLQAMHEGSREARRKGPKKTGRRHLWTGAAGTLLAAGIGGLILVSNDGFPSGFDGGSEPGSVNDYEEEDQDPDTEEGEEIPDGQTLSIEKPVFTVLSDEERAEEDPERLNETEEARLSHNGTEEHVTLERASIDALPVYLHYPEEWERVESGDEEAEYGVTLSGDEGKISVKLHPHAADPDTIFSVYESVVDELEPEHRALQTEEGLPDLKAKGDLSDERIGDLVQGEVYYDEASGYGEYQVMAVNGQYLSVHTEIDAQTPHWWALGKLIYATWSENLPALVYPDEVTTDERTGRAEQVEIREQIDAGIGQSPKELFVSEAHGFSTYLPEEMTVTADADDVVVEDPERDGLMVFTALPDGITEEEAVNDLRTRAERDGRDVSDDAQEESWLVESMQYMDANGQQEGYAYIVTHEGQYYVLETVSDDTESLFFFWHRMSGTFLEYLEWPDGTRLIQG